MSRRFAGKAAIVTGAEGGIGRATALRLASEGAQVFAVYGKGGIGKSTTSSNL